MLPKKNRLSGFLTYSILRSGHKKDLSSGMAIFYQVVPGKDFQAAVVIGKKTRVKAVKKNYLRRRFYTSLRQFAKQNKGLRVVVLLRRFSININQDLEQLGEALNSL